MNTFTHLEIKPDLLKRLCPGYTDGRNNVWAKFDFGLLNFNPAFELLKEIDKWRFFHFLALQLQMKNPVPLDPEYLARKGFDLLDRPLPETLNSLSPFVDVQNNQKTVTLFQDYCYEDAATLVTSPPAPSLQDTPVPRDLDVYDIRRIREEEKKRIRGEGEEPRDEEKRNVIKPPAVAWLQFSDSILMALGNTPLTAGDHGTIRSIFNHQYSDAAKNGGWPKRAESLTQIMKMAKEKATNPMAYFITETHRQYPLAHC